METGQFFVALGNGFASSNAWSAMAYGFAFFASIYLVLCGGNWLLTRRLLPALGIGRRIDEKPLRDGQLRYEWGWSMLSVLNFGIGSVLPWAFLRWGWAGLPQH